jgi:hypothetical protein
MRGTIGLPRQSHIVRFQVGGTQVEAVKRGRRLSSNAFCNPKNEDQIKSGESEDTSVLHSARAKAIRVYRSLLGHLAGR